MVDFSPPFSNEGLLPGNQNYDRCFKLVSPYRQTMEVFVSTWAYTAIRAQLVRSLIEYRRVLRSLNFHRGIQWIGGSFTENIESLKGRGPADLDLISFVLPSSGGNGEEVWGHNLELFQKMRLSMKQSFNIDGFIGEMAPDYSRYSEREFIFGYIMWYEMFSLSQQTNTRKGFIEIPIETLDDDQGALELLEQAAATCSWKLEVPPPPFNHSPLNSGPSGIGEQWR